MKNCGINENEKPSAVEIFYQGFTDKQLQADYTSRRGVKKLPYMFAFMAGGKNSFQLGREYYFPQNLSKEMDGHNFKAMRIASAAEMAKINVGNIAPVDNVIGSITGLITLRDDCQNMLAQFPFSDCVNNQNGGKDYFLDVPAKIDNCSFSVLGGTATDDVNGIAFYFFI